MHKSYGTTLDSFFVVLEMDLWYLRKNIATEVSLCLENFIYIFSHSCLLCMTCWSKVYLCITCFGATHGGSLLWDHNCLVPVFLFLLTRSYLFGLVMRFYPVTVQRYLYMSHTRINIVESSVVILLLSHELLVNCRIVDSYISLVRGNRLHVWVFLFVDSLYWFDPFSVYIWEFVLNNDHAKNHVDQMPFDVIDIFQ